MDTTKQSALLGVMFTAVWFFVLMALGFAIAHWLT
jgi:hypothetical protein